MSVDTPSALAAVAAPDLVILPLSRLVYTAHNPRGDGGEDLAGLAASMASEQEPYLIQPPTVERIARATYRVVSGERRVRGAALAGWVSIACLVYGPLDPLLAHMMRLVENLHRADLHPLDAAIALKIAWLAENGRALRAGAAVRAVLATPTAPFDTLLALAAVAAQAGFVPTHPPIPWEVLLGRLGLAIERERLKKLLRVLNVSPAVLQLIRPLDLSEAALRSLGTLAEADQQQLAGALQAHPSLGRSIRGIARRVRQQGYSIEQALAEAQGRVYTGQGAEGAADASDQINDNGEASVVEPDCADAVLRLVAAADQFIQALAALQATTSTTSLATIPPPWGEVAAEAVALVRAELRKRPQA